MLSLTEEQTKFMDQLHDLRIFRQDILSLFLGLRKCIEHPHLPEQAALLDEALPALGLKSKTYKHKQIGIKCVYIAKEDSHITKVISFLESDKVEPNSIDWHNEHGLLLGYPDCCCRAYAGNANYVPPSMKSMSWKMNHLFNMESKVSKDEREMVERLHPHQFPWGSYLIPHVPCSFDCPLSLEYGNRLFAQLRLAFKDYAEQLEGLLKNPILAVDTYNFIVFKGKVEGNTIKYSGITDVHNLADKDLLSEMGKANSIVKSGDRLAMYKDSELLNEIDLNATLYNFC
jgi:hypothetical protein